MVKLGKVRLGKVRIEQSVNDRTEESREVAIFDK
jgi:hypothetical protein